jgi:selenocysteine-specific elongation factor
MTVIATAGHVDHGKSTLVLGLTGTDPDRWGEEKARGLTIDLGFATTELPSGRALSFVDVPGHIRFLRNMLAGVGAVDGCLFVVAATEGWKPQSEEHLRILSLLGVERGVVAVTKIDQVDGELFELACLDVEDHVAGTFLEPAPVVGVAAPTGAGMDDLRAALDDLAAAIRQRDETANPRLWVDRSFSPAGAGTVVTGTLAGGTLAVGDEVVVVPGDLAARVRGLQSHHRQLERIGPGNRVAVNLAGVSHGDVVRGHAVVSAGAWHQSTMIDAELTVLASLDHPVGRRGAYAAYIGSAELPAKVRVLGDDAIRAGATGTVRLHLQRPVPLLPGDRFILRESGRDETVGGGEVLDVDPVLPAARAKPDRSVERVVAERGWVDQTELRRLTGEARPATVGRWVVAQEALTATLDAIQSQIEGAGPLGLDLAVLSDRERAAVELIGGASVHAGRVTIGERPDPLADHRWLAALRAEPFAPPGASGIDRGEIRELVRRGDVVEHDSVYFAAEAISEASARLAVALGARPEGVTVAEVRDLLGTTRKYVLPLLAHLDLTGVTRRRGDLRIGGPRLPRLPAGE